MITKFSWCVECIDKETYYIPKEHAASYDGNILNFIISKY